MLSPGARSTMSTWRSRRGGIRLARRIANGLDGGFFVLDRERDVARALLDTKDGKILIDVAGFSWRQSAG